DCETAKADRRAVGDIGNCIGEARIDFGFRHRSSRDSQFVIPAQAGIHSSVARRADKWVPAFAGTTMCAYRNWRPSFSPVRKMFGFRNIDRTSAPFGDLAMWRLPFGRQT